MLQELIKPSAGTTEPVIRGSDLERFVEGVIYPATKQEIIAQALASGGPTSILAFLNKLSNESYSSPGEVCCSAFINSYFFGND